MQQKQEGRSATKRSTQTRQAGLVPDGFSCSRVSQLRSRNCLPMGTGRCRPGVPAASCFRLMLLLRKRHPPLVVLYDSEGRGELPWLPQMHRC